MANYFRDLGKKSQDLFKKNYPVAGFEFELYTKTDSAVELRAVGRKVIDPKKLEKEQPVSVDLELAKKFDEYGIKVKGVAKTSRQFTGEFNLEPKAVKDLKVTVKAEHRNNALSVKGGAEFKQENGTVTGEVTVKKQSLSNIYGSVSLAYEGFTAGAEGNYVLGNNSGVGSYGGKIDYCTKKWSFTGFGSHLGASRDMIGFNFYHLYSSDVQLGAQLEANVADTKNLPVSAIFGGAWTMEDKSIVRAKFMTAGGRLGLSWQQNIRPNLSLTVASDLSLNDDTHKFGFGIKFVA